jgi:uncharacterized protein (DUF488 family)
MVLSRRPLRLPSRSVREQAERKQLWNESRNVNSADFYTIGYSGRSSNDIVELLQSVEARSLIDIRYNPVSMYKPDLSKKNLQRTIAEAGLQYLHMPEWGVPRDVRAKAIETGDRQVIWDWYDVNVVGLLIGRNLHTFFNVAEHPVAFMCVETDPAECHRHRLSVALEARGLCSFDL